MRDKKIECGDSRLWGRPEDRFIEACTFHDYHYQRKHDLVAEGEAPLWSRADVDRGFLELMLARSERLRHRLQAYAYYGIVRAVGGLWWRDRKGSPLRLK